MFAEFSYDGGHTWAPGDRALHVEQAPWPAVTGDYNDSGTVDAADYVAWRDGQGSTYTHLDYLVWSANFGATASGVRDSVLAGIPEPAAARLLMFATLCVAGSCRKVRLRP